MQDRRGSRELGVIGYQEQAFFWAPLPLISETWLNTAVAGERASRGSASPLQWSENKN